MESSSNRAQAEQKKQAEIRKQIALLQAQLVDTPVSTNDTPLPPASPKRKLPEETCLAPATPSPKKRKLHHGGVATNHRRSSAPYTGSRDTSSRSESLSRPSGSRPLAQQPPKPAPSNVLAKLAGMQSKSKDATPIDQVIRSFAFSETPAPRANLGLELDIVDAPKRDDRLALIEDLEMGPTDHKPPLDDPFFKQVEPNSGIRLLSRSVPHDDIQEYLTGRYYLSPSRLYSVIRLQSNKQGYDVPVDGDWVTIAVVAERGPIKYSRAPVAIGPEDDGAQADGGSNELVGDGNGRFQFADPKQPSKAKRKEPAPHRKSGKKYLNIKLVDFGARARASSSIPGGKAAIRGDAFLSLLLFESDGFDMITTAESKSKKVYRGGSRGAFEDLSKLGEGDVVALLNPKILKPFQRASDTPHPTSNILAVTPESSESIIVLGRAKDLGKCPVVKRDGKVCGSWCDKRVSEVCEWHIQNAVERRRAGRAEFSIGTSGMSASNTAKRKPAYDPARQWGLKPEPSAAGASSGSTYVVSGHIVGGSAGSIYVAETMGREGQAKAKRKFGRDADRELKALLERDKEGMKAVVRAREVAKEMEEKGKVVKTRGKSKNKTVGNGKGGDKKGKEKANSDSDWDSNSDLEVEEPAVASTQKNAYSARIIKQLGFDPTVKAGHKRSDDAAIQKKLEALSTLQSSRKDIELGPRPGQRIRSGVVAPPKHATPTTSMTLLLDPAYDIDEAELEEEMTSFGKPALLADEKMIDLDDSSDEEGLA